MVWCYLCCCLLEYCCDGSSSAGKEKLFLDPGPGKRVFKVRSKKNNAEMQIDATTGDILSIAKRRSDLIEALHDGSFFGDFVHTFMMPMMAAVTVYLTLTGLYMWLAPIIKRRTKHT
jgi:uncharacterized iron-regulated membrane protein